MVKNMEQVYDKFRWDLLALVNSFVYLPLSHIYTVALHK